MAVTRPKTNEIVLSSRVDPNPLCKGPLWRPLSAWQPLRGVLVRHGNRKRWHTLGNAAGKGPTKNGLEPG